tara:strand:+ start:316 stop:441 length:126 start_codon:yes stop_codon:yes gene_type:complete
LLFFKKNYYDIRRGKEEEKRGRREEGKIENIEKNKIIKVSF